MRILHYITLLELGGAQQNTLYTCRRLAERGHEVTLACGAGGLLDEEASRGPFRFIPLPELVRPIHPWRDARALLAMIRLVREIRPDIVHTHSSKAGMLGRVAGRLGGAGRVVHTVHGWSFSPFHRKSRQRLYRGLEWLAHWFADHIVAVSRDNIDEGLRMGLVRPGRCSVIRSGIDFEEFSPKGPGRESIRRELGVGDDEVLVVNVSCSKPQKDPMTFVQAAGIAARKEPRLRFALVGDGELSLNLERAHAEAGLGERLVRTGWRRDIPAILRAADIVALTSLWEGLPRVVVQARACRRAVVATPVNGTPELITDGLNGLLRPVQDAEAFAEAFVLLARDAELRAKLAACTDEPLEEFGQERMVDDQESLYRRLLGLAEADPAGAPAERPGAGAAAAP